MGSSEETRFLVLIRDRAKIPANDLEIRIMADVVSRHLEHSEVKICYGAKGATRDQDDGLFCGIAHDSCETM